MRTYKFKCHCTSAEDSEIIRTRVCDEMLHKLSDKGQKVEYISALVTYNPIEFECIVKLEVF